MLFFNKRGVAIGTIVVLILILFAAFILFAAVRLWGITTETLIDRDACRMSVLIKAKSIIAGVEDFPWHVGLKCPTAAVDVSKKDEGSIKDIFSGSKKKKKIGGIDFPVRSVKIEKESDIKKIIADEMYDTWYKFGAGKLNFFGKYSREKKCVLGSIIEFSAGVKKDFSTIEDFEVYLLEEKIPGKEITYYNYFTQGEGILFSKDEAGKIDIPTNEDLAIIFKLEQVGRGTYIDLFIGGGVAAGAGLAVFIGSGPIGWVAGGAIGLVVAGGTILFGAAEEARYKAVMLPILYEDISEECDVLI